jgi:MFS superfamily sulfate permease-like transporter
MLGKVLNRQILVKDSLASIVVFLVALPLCMGIALASGVSPEKGIITGIIGGIVVGLIAGSPLQVSGPAAGLVVLVWQTVDKVGLDGLGAAVFLAGILQVLSGLVGAGQIFRAVSPTVIYGMLSGIGVLIFSSQFHVMFDDKPSPSGLINLLTIPQTAISTISNIGLPTAAVFAGLISLLTLTTVVSWDKFKKGRLKLIPGALIGVVAGTICASLFGFDVKFVTLPADILGSVELTPWDGFSKIMTAEGMIIVLSLALVASAETLLCATAVDKMHSGPRTKYNQELIAQGIGNSLCGLVAALPVTGVIVRSSANLQAGGTTKLSAILHGVWLLGLVILFPKLLNLIPTASLAALLVVIGFKLINFGILKELKKRGREEVLIFLLTVLSIVSFDLLTGIMIGVGATILQLIHRLTHIEISLTQGDSKNEFNLDLAGAVTFLRLPALSKKLDKIPHNATIHVHMNHLSYIDHACLELLTSWGDQHEKTGGKVFLEWDALHHYVGSGKPILKQTHRRMKEDSPIESLQNSPGKDLRAA